MKFEAVDTMIKSKKDIFNERREKVFNMLMEMYNSDMDTFKVTDEENEYTSINSLRSLMVEVSHRVAEKIVKDKINYDSATVHRALWDKNPFKIRKEPCRAVIFVKVTKYTEKDFALFRGLIRKH